MVRPTDNQGFCLLPTANLQADVEFFTTQIGLQLKALYPSDSPKIAELSGFGLSLRLDADYKGSVASLLIQTQDEGRAPAISPGGVEVCWETMDNSAKQNIDDYSAEICTLRSTPWVKGKAGTQTRELIPSRLGGAVTATHIRIPNGGSVADRVHYHTAGLQLVFCVSGWIKLVYEDQGEPITLHAGDCVNQPPHIRHKVLETSNGLEVIEFSMPAEHATEIDNDLELPNEQIDSHRLFDGQRFLHYKHAHDDWKPHRLPGFVSCDTGISTASSELAGAQVVRGSRTLLPYTATHDAQLLFTYMLAGSVRINGQLMVAGDAFTLPPIDSVRVGDIAADARMLEVSVPGNFRTLF